MTANFDVSAHYDATVEQVLDVLADRAFYESLAGKTWLEPDRVDAIDREPESLTTVVHYSYVGKLSSKADRFVKRDDLKWIEEVRYDLNSGAITGGVLVDDPGKAKMISASAEGSLKESGGGADHRVKGAIKVHGVPLVGGRAEKWLANTFAEHTRRLQAALAERLTS